MFYNWFFGEEKKNKCGGCKSNRQGINDQFVSEINTLKAKCNDLELDYIELENLFIETKSKNEELKSKNEELISVLIKVSDIARVAVECNKKGY